MLRILFVALGIALTCGARAATEIELWHAMRGDDARKIAALAR